MRVRRTRVVIYLYDSLLLRRSDVIDMIRVNVRPMTVALPFEYSRNRLFQLLWTEKKPIITINPTTTRRVLSIIIASTTWSNLRETDATTRVDPSNTLVHSTSVCGESDYHYLSAHTRCTRTTLWITGINTRSVIINESMNALRRRRRNARFYETVLD